MSAGEFLRRGLRFIIKGIPNNVVTVGISYTQPNGRLRDQKIIVTGGGRGLGFAMTKKFIAEGAKVLITGRNEETLRKASEETGCHYILYDICDTESSGNFILNAAEILGGIDCLVNNAGISLHEPTFFDVTPESFSRQLKTNLEGPFFLTQAFIQYLKDKQNGGNIIFISSETGDTADCRPYGYTKAAVNSMVRGLAHLFKEKNIRINAVAPGITASSMTGVGSTDNLHASRYGAGRFYLPEEVAEVASFLLSPESGCISGQIITCNNAQTINARWK